MFRFISAWCRITRFIEMARAYTEICVLTCDVAHWSVVMASFLKLKDCDSNSHGFHIYIHWRCVIVVVS